MNNYELNVENTVETIIVDSIPLNDTDNSSKETYQEHKEEENVVNCSHQ